MISVSVTIPNIADKLKTFQKGGAGYDSVLRTVATSLLGEMKNRIYEQGLDSSGSPIGNYSKEYMVVRTNAFQNNLATQGKNKGKPKVKATGVFTKGKNKGQTRPGYNRTNDTKVVISLTRQMENDFVVIPTDNGYGLGFNNHDNFLKVGYVENTYGKKIFGATDSEKESVFTVANDEVHKVIDKTFGSYKY